MTCIRSEIIGHGHYQPAKVLTNDDMAKIVETSDEWITERTGIKSVSYTHLTLPTTSRV